MDGPKSTLNVDPSLRKSFHQSILDARRRNDWLSGRSPAITVIFVLADMGAVSLAALLSHFAIAGSFNIGPAGRASILVSVLLTWLVFNWGGLYTSWRGRGYVAQIRAATIGWCSVIGALILAAYLIDVSPLYDRIMVVMWGVIGYVLIIVTRLAVMASLRAARRHGFNHQKIIVIGGGDWGGQVVEKVNDSEWLGLDMVCVLDDRPELQGTEIHGIPVWGGYERLLTIVKENAIDEVWICLPLGSSRVKGSHQINKIMDMLGQTTVTQRLLPEFEELRILNQPVTEIMGLPVITLNTSPMHGINRFIKGLEDRVLAALILVLISPVMLAIAVAIKLDSRGPIIFRQLRDGSDGKPFYVMKFRTMREHDEKPGVVTQASKTDPRVTKVGQFLRRTSLDELPQFLNVLQGKMSVVGPRPHAVEHNEYYQNKISSYMQRHSVKPGITGWAQVNGYRGETDDISKMEQRVSLDLYYIEHWSLWFDIRIIARTILYGFHDKNAY